jgi:hypothetical protein
VRFASVLAVALLASSAFAGADDNDKVRLLSSNVTPSVLVPGEGSATLAARVAVRPTDGLGSNPDDGKFRFHIEFVWEWLASGGAVVATARAETPLAAPFAYIELPASDGTKSFIDASARVSFDGKDLPEGAYAFRLTAHVFRTSTKPGEKAKLIGTSSPLSGSIALSPRPAPPSVDPFPPVTGVPLITFTGHKPANTELLVDGLVRVPLSAATSWTTTKTLAPGPNTFLFSDRTAFGIESLPVTVAVTLLNAPPEPPIVSVLPEFTNSRTITLSGSKQSGTGIVVNGVVVVPVDDLTTWSATVTLQENRNELEIHAVDRAGRLSLAAGSQLAGIASGKPVIRDLAVAPAEIRPGESASITYRLFAVVPPAENAGLDVSVRIEAGDLLIKQLFSGVQQAGPDGPTYTATWDGLDGAGRAALVNTSYRVVVSAARVAPTSSPRELVDPNPKETAVLVLGSQHVLSRDKKLEIVFRPDDAKLVIDAFPPLPARAGRLLTSRGLHPRGGCYRVRIDRPFDGAAVGVLTTAQADGGMLRPFWWDELQQDWRPLGRTNWNPSSRKLSFVLPGPGLVVFATSSDVDDPYISDVRLDGASLTLRARDNSSGVDTRQVRLRRGGQDLSARIAHKLLNGVHDVQLTVDEVSSLDGLTLYVEDWAGHGRLFPLDERSGR